MNLVYVGIDRQLHLVSGWETGSVTTLALTAPPSFTLVPSPQEAWSWPTWSPDGTWIAAFATVTRDDEAGPARVVTMSADGLRQTEWADLPDAAPLYLQWHPAGDALCALTQVDDDLHLGLIRESRLGVVKPVAEGVPLFFNWTPDGSRLWVHHGERGKPGGSLLIRDPLGDDEDQLYPKTPGSFCAPVFVAGRTLIAVAGHANDDETRTSLVVSCTPDGAGEIEIADRAGLIALAGGPGGLGALTFATGGEGSPYSGLELFDPASGEAPRRISEGALLAFTWVPGGKALVGFRVDAPANCMSALLIDAETGAETVLGTFWPTRDLFFWLHFFDQFVQSHPLVSPDGRWVTWSGYPAGGGQADLSAPPCVWVRSLVDVDAKPIEVGRGSFATFPPVPADLAPVASGPAAGS